MYYKKLLVILTCFAISSINADKIPLDRQKKLKKDIDECFGKYLATKDKNPMNVAYKFSGASKVDAKTAKEQEKNLRMIISNIKASAPFKKAVDQCCSKIFSGLEKFDADEVNKTLGYYVELKELESLCPDKVKKFYTKKK